jgi:hypothetical protein
MRDQNWIFREILNNRNADEIDKKWKEIEKNESAYSLYLSYLAKNDTEKALSLLKDMEKENIQIKKRSVIPIYKSMMNSKYKTTEINSFFYDKIIKFELNEKDLMSVFDCYKKHKEYNCKNFNKWLIHYGDSISYYFAKEIDCVYNQSKNQTKFESIKKGICDGVKLKKIHISRSEKNKLMKNIEKHYMEKHRKNMNKMKKFIKNKKHDMIIDAANVLYSKSTITFNSYKILHKIYMKLLKEGYKPLIVICDKHKKNIRKFKKTQRAIISHIYNMWDYTEDLFETPPYINDDWIFMYMAFNNNAMVVSNDNFKDHIYNISFKDSKHKDVLKKWIENNSVKHESDDLIYPPSYTKEIQNINDKLYVPIEDKNMCIILNNDMKIT